jgi:hypothetical protein
MKFKFLNHIKNANNRIRFKILKYGFFKFYFCFYKKNVIFCSFVLKIYDFFLIYPPIFNCYSLYLLN